MKLLAFRHGPAVDPDEFEAAGGGGDRERPLTDRGRRRVRRCAAATKRFVPKLDLVLSSGLTRAWQTAELLAEVYDDAPIQRCDSLEPEQPPEAFLAVLSDLPYTSTVAAIGHRPDLEILVAWLTAGISTPCIELKKAGSALVEFPGVVSRGHGVLRWALTPAQAERMRK